MRNLLSISKLVSALLLACAPLAMVGQSPVLPAASDGAFITVTAPSGCITDGSGTPLASGSIMIQGVDGTGTNAIPYGYGTGQAVTTAVTRTITAGSIVGSLQLVNPANSSPSQILYHISIEDNSTYKTTNYTGVPLYLNDAPVSGRNTVFNFCKMNTGLAVTSIPTTVVVGPAGPPGPAGSGCGAANCLTSAPSASQSITQPANTSFGVTGSTSIPTVQPSVKSETYPGNFTNLDEVLVCPNGPQLTLGAAGSFDSGTMRDPAIWKARGKIWVLYTASPQAASGTQTSVTLGLAYTSDTDTGCTGWTKAGQVVVPNPTSGQWNSGAIFSPWVYYNTATDDTYLYFTASVLPAQWFGGPFQIGVIHVSPGADYTVPANWPMPSSPLITPTAAWEGTTVYAPSVIKVGTTYNMYYNGVGFYLGLAQSSSPLGPFTKLPTNTAFTTSSPSFVYGENPIYGDGSSEEASCAVLEGGGIQCFNDDALGTIGGIGFEQWSTTDPLGVGNVGGGWTKNASQVYANPPSFAAGHEGAMAQVELNSGSWLMVTNGGPGGAPDAYRQIFFLRYTLGTHSSQQAAPPQNQLIVGRGCGGVGSTITACAPSGDASVDIVVGGVQQGVLYYDSGVLNLRSINHFLLNAPTFQSNGSTNIFGPGATSPCTGVGSTITACQPAGSTSDPSIDLTLGGVQEGVWYYHSGSLFLRSANPFVLNASSFQLGSSGTAFVSQSLISFAASPASVPANSCVDTTVSGVTGVTGSSHHGDIAPPGLPAGLTSPSAYFSATAGTVVMRFCNVTGAAVTPNSGNYSMVVWN